MTLLMLVALGSVGGISYAANAAKGAARVVQKAISPTGVISVLGLNSGGDQYRPGFGFGDPNHNHTGPPGLKRQGTASGTPPIEKARETADGVAVVVKTTIVLDEQAALFIQVLDQRGRTIVLTQKSARGSTKIGGSKLEGKPSKTLRYTVLVPRPIPIELRIPAHLVREDQAYRLRIIARDKQGNKSVLIIPFRVDK